MRLPRRGIRDWRVAGKGGSPGRWRLLDGNACFQEAGTVFAPLRGEVGNMTCEIF